MESFKIKKVLNNNVLIAVHKKIQEIALIGKGIGFGRKQGEEISPQKAEKIFVLKNQKEQEQYKMLVTQVDEDFIEVMNDVIHHITNRVHGQLNEHIHIALTDHISFAIKRLEQGLEFTNPFLLETKSLYPTEYEISEEVIKILQDKLGVSFPEGEIGFVALHIHSAISNHTLSEVNQYSQLIRQVVGMIENSLDVTLDRQSIHYLRLIRHLRYTIDRVKSGEVLEEPESLKKVLKQEYPICYNLSWKVIKVMQQALKVKVYDAEAVYLTMHLQRLVSKNI